MDVEKIQKLNNLIKECKEFNLTQNPSEIIELEKSPEMSDNERLLRKLQFSIKNNNDEIESLKKSINLLREEIKDLKARRKEEIQAEFTSNQEKSQATLKASEEKQEKFISNKNIDRNNVAPADVSIENIFYYGQK